MDVRKKTIEEYLELFAGSAPVPGGGGVSSVVGALAAASGEMVCSLTLGKKKFENIEPEIKGIALKLGQTREKLLTLADKDAEVFEPLAEAYKDDTKLAQVSDGKFIDNTSVFVILRIIFYYLFRLYSVFYSISFLITIIWQKYTI